MIDRSARDELAKELRHFAAGLETNNQFEMACEQHVRIKDRAVQEILNAAWFLYDDFTDHRLKGQYALDREGRRDISKWILFLQTDLEYEWPRFPTQTTALVFIGSILLLLPAKCLAAYLPWTASVVDRFFDLIVVAYCGLFMFGALAIRIPKLRRFYDWILWPLYAICRPVDSWWLRRRLGPLARNLELWPFARREDYEAALKEPKLLCGKAV